MKRLNIIVLCILLVGMSGVTGHSVAQDQLNVVATTTIIADVARNIGGDWVNVDVLIPAGSDVHTFNPAPRDVIAIVGADVVLVNGASLEEGLLEVIEENAGVEPVVVSNGVEVLSFEGHDHNHEAEENHEHEDHAFIGQLGLDADCAGDNHAHDDEAHTDEEHTEEEHEHGPCDPHLLREGRRPRRCIAPRLPHCLWRGTETGHR